MSWHLVCVDTNKGLPSALLYGKERLEITVIFETTDIEHGLVFSVRCAGSKVRFLHRGNGFWYIEGSGDYEFDEDLLGRTSK